MTRVKIKLKFVAIALMSAFSAAGTILPASAQNWLMFNGWGIPIPSSLSIPIPGISFGRGAARSGGTLQTQQAPETPRSRSLQLTHDAYLANKAGRHDSARQLLEQAISLDPGNDAAWSNLMVECTATGHLQQAIDVGSEYLRLNPHGSQRQKVTGMLDNAREELSRQQNIASSLGPSRSDDYLTMASEDGVLKHWAASAMPIKVFINDGSAVRGYSAEFATTMIRSFKDWAFVSNNHMSFVPAQSADEAQIICNWIDSPKKFPGPDRYGECGLAQPWFEEDGTIHKATIWILTVNRFNGKSFSPGAVRATCLHEIGHALGLVGHSDSPKDVMYFMAGGEPDHDPHLSWRDVNTLNRLYDAAATAAPSEPIAAETSTPNPSELASNSVEPPSASGFLQKEAFSTTAQPFNGSQSAIQFFESAVDSAPDSVSLLDDLGTAYNNRAVEAASSGDLDGAQRALERALAIHRNSSDHNRLHATLSNYMLLLVKQGRLADAQSIYTNFQRGVLTLRN